jgi:cytochrome b561
MTRVWDYISFAIWFSGLGYIVLWLLGSPNHLVLPPALHAIGVAAAVLIPVRLLLRIVKRRRAAGASPAIHARQPAAVLRPLRRKASYPIRTVKPRSHFGLRGVPH